MRRRDPPNCDPEDCDYFVGINTNENNATYLDFYLTGVISGWVAVPLLSSLMQMWSGVILRHSLGHSLGQYLLWTPTILSPLPEVITETMMTL